MFPVKSPPTKFRGIVLVHFLFPLNTFLSRINFSKPQYECHLNILHFISELQLRESCYARSSHLCLNIYIVPAFHCSHIYPILYSTSHFKDCFLLHLLFYFICSTLVIFHFTHLLDSLNNLVYLQCKCLKKQMNQSHPLVLCVATIFPDISPSRR